MGDPVVVSGPLVQEEVVYVVVDIEVVLVSGVVRAVEVVTLDLLVLDITGQPGRHAHQGVPGCGLALAGGHGRVDTVPVFLFPAEVAGREGRIGAFNGVVQPPVQTVDIEVNERAVPSRIADGLLQLPGELVADELRRGAAPNPTVVEVRPQDDSVELVDRIVAEQRKLEFRRTVVILEKETERVLHVLGLAPHAAVHAGARVDLEFVGTVRIEVLQRRAVFDPLRVRVTVDSVYTEQIIDVHHDRHRGN